MKFKILVIIFIIIFGFQSWVKAADINEFEIEGMSLGDSLLEYSSKENILSSSDTPYKNKKFSMFAGLFENASRYEGYLVHYKTNDPIFTIEALQGMILFEKNFSKCLETKKKVVNELDEIFNDVKKNEWEAEHAGDKSGKSKSYNTEYKFKSGYIRIICNDWSKNMKYIDKLAVSIVSNEFTDWINNEAYE